MCFTLLAQAEADGVANPSAEALLMAEICYADGTSETKSASFNAFCAKEEQQIILNVKPEHSEKTVEKVGFFLVYNYNANTMSVTEVMISVDESGTSYTYDADGNLTSAADNAERNQEYDYNEVGEVTEYTDEKNNNYHYIYDETNKHRLDLMYSESTGTGFGFVYDSYGNVTGVNSGEYSEENSALDILTSTTYTYTASGEFVTGIIDARGLNTVYAVNETTGLTESITTPATLLGVDKNVITKYTYDIGNYNLLTSGIYSSDDPSTLISGVTYTYNNPLAQLKNITRTDGQKYSFTYDIWGRVTDIKVGNKLLSHSAYEKTHSNDTQLEYTEYGNGDRVYYTYDSLDRIIALSTTEGGAPYVSYDYNSEGLVGRVTDNLSGVTTEYHYDLLGRLVSSTLSQGGIDRYFYTYNESNQLTSVSAYLPTGELAVEAEYTYDQSGRLIESAQGEYTVHYTYDVLSRVTCERTVHEDGAEYYTYYSYLEADNGNTTSFVETVTYKTKASGASAETTVGSIHYTYDKNGFISSVTEKDANGNTTSSESYTYDALGQLKTVTRGANVTEYTYDNSGNILSKKVNGTVVGTYTYTDSQWKDLLTSYNGETITYDGIGNPTTYIGWDNLTWSMGRRLTSLSNDSTSITYSYDASGQRVSKTVNGVTTEFYSDDRGVLVLLTNDDYSIRFYADAEGNIDSFNYNNEQFYYVRNAQNDVIGITDSTGAFVARYTYDEWGNITSITDGQGNDVSANPSHIANLNPLRYRSYFCDVETGLYYVTTRYYDPAIGRFISTDTTDVLTVTPRELTDKNLFAYCDNNPVMRIDYGGQFWESFLDVVSFGASIVEVCINPTDPWAWASLAGDAVDLIPFVTGVGETTRAVKTTVKVVDKSTDVVDAAKTIRKTADATDDIRKATGSYEILYESGKSYIGKGGFDRAITSANRYVKKDDKVVSILWKSAPDPRQAFIDEYLMQRRFGGVLSYNPTLDTYNKIWSPGRGYFGD